MKEVTKASRSRVITDISQHHFNRDDMLASKGKFEQNKTLQEYWTVFFTVRDGLLPEKIWSSDFDTLDEAQSFIEKHPVGTEFSAIYDLRNSLPEDQRWVIDDIVKGGLFSPNPSSAGDEDSPLAFQVLEKAGVKNVNNVGLTRVVQNYLGSVHLEELKCKHGDNWEAAAAFEYCALNFPHSSAAYLAAAYQYCYYIKNDDFAAGYFWRDLEVVYYGVETGAVKALEMRKRAGEKGKEASTKARLARIASLLNGMEKVASRNPDLCALGVKPLAALGFQEAERENPNLWAQGRGQTEEYLGEIRRGEAGKTFQSRFNALFPKKPPMGF